MVEGKITVEEIQVDKIIEEMRKYAYKGAGALAIFIGFVKGIVDGNTVEELEYTAYEPYASKKIEEIVNEEFDEEVFDIRVYHRIGRLKAGEPTIYIFVAAKTRKKAFEKASRILERIKHEVPIFKLEKRSDGEYWVLGDGRRVRRLSK